MNELPDPSLFPVLPGYEIEEEIGRGAMSVVYRARQTALDRPVAIKVLKGDGDRDVSRVLRLLREARTAGRLNHPGIVRGIDAGTAGGLCYFVMEYVEGRSLREILDTGGALEAREAARIARDIAAALAEVHRRGIVHRDVKPANILIDAGGRAKLLDLGLAKHTMDSTLTVAGQTVGTPQYMAPEQAMHPDRVDRRADIFSLGATLYHMVTGRSPFEAPSVGAVVTRLLYDDPAPASSLVRGLPPALDRILARALAKSPAERYRAASHLVLDLDAFLDGRPVAAGPGRTRRPRVAAALALAGTAAAILFATRPGDRGGGPVSAEGTASAPARGAGAPMSLEAALAVLRGTEAAADPEGPAGACTGVVRAALDAWAGAEEAGIRGLLEAGDVVAAAERCGEALAGSFTARFGAAPALFPEPLRAEAEEAFRSVENRAQAEVAKVETRMADALAAALASEVERLLAENRYIDRATAEARLGVVLTARPGPLRPPAESGTVLFFARSVEAVLTGNEDRFRRARAEAGRLAEGRRYEAAVRRLAREVGEAGAGRVLPHAVTDLADLTGRWREEGRSFAESRRRDLEDLVRSRHGELARREFEPLLGAVEDLASSIPDDGDERVWAGPVRDLALALAATLRGAAALPDRALRRLEAGRGAGGRVTVTLAGRAPASGRIAAIDRTAGTFLLEEDGRPGVRLRPSDLTPESLAALAEEASGPVDPRIIAWMHWGDDLDPARARAAAEALPGQPFRDFLLRLLSGAGDRPAAAAEGAAAVEVRAAHQVGHVRARFLRGDWSGVLSSARILMKGGEWSGTKAAVEAGPDLRRWSEESEFGLRVDALQATIGGRVSRAAESRTVNVVWTFEDPREAADFTLSAHVQGGPGRLVFRAARPPVLEHPDRFPSADVRLPLEAGPEPLSIDVDVRFAEGPGADPRFFSISVGPINVGFLGVLGRVDPRRRLHGLERDVRILTPLRQTALWVGPITAYEQYFEPIPGGGEAFAPRAGARYTFRVRIDNADKRLDVVETTGGRTLVTRRGVPPLAASPHLTIRSATDCEVAGIRASGRITW